MLLTRWTTPTRLPPVHLNVYCLLVIQTDLTPVHSHRPNHLVFSILPLIPRLGLHLRSQSLCRLSIPLLPNIKMFDQSFINPFTSIGLHNSFPSSLLILPTRFHTSGTIYVFTVNLSNCYACNLLPCSTKFDSPCLNGIYPTITLGTLISRRLISLNRFTLLPLPECNGI